MTDEHVSQLSALVDGELLPRHALTLFAAVERDPALAAAWERYHLIGQVVRGGRVQPDARGIAAAVREQLRAQPRLLVPRAAVIPPRVWRPPFAGAALAAAAVLLAVFAVPSLYQGPDPVAALALPAASPLGTASGPRREDAPNTARRWQTDRSDLAGKLDLFLVNHQEAAPATGVKGMLPYATLVGYETGR
ncbi:MAG TPA: sigma-E factor negative regulatory protein [Lamprocystis sp. (in: g-proteobacteria)]|nr:sigma-E factor negative regulatory protein [Lamprocystis sp. (in: g-proteobacteria)]